MAECQLCNDIWQMFADPGSAKLRIDFGAFDRALSSPCPKHAPTVESLNRILETYISSDSEPRHVRHRWPVERRGVGFSKALRGSPIVHLRETVRKGFRSRYLEMLPVHKKNTAYHPGTAQILDPR
jgi:hypothetical protein